MPTSKFLKPFALGLVVGALFITVLGFANDWVITAKASETRIHDAQVTVQGRLCASLANEYIKSGKVTVDLAGYQEEAREAREKLAEKFAITLPGETEVDPRVIDTCSQLLNKPST